MKSFDKNFGLSEKILSFLLALTMILSILQFQVYAEEFQTDSNSNQYTNTTENKTQNKPSINKIDTYDKDGQYTLDENMNMLQPLSEIIDANTIIVENETEFINALKNSQYTTIYLGADITITSSSNNNIVVSRAGPLVINGTDPRKGGTQHTFTDYNGSGTGNLLGGACTDITFKNMDVNLRNYYGIYYAKDNTNTTVTLDNVTGSARQFFHGISTGRNTTLVISDSNLYLKNTGLGDSQEFAQTTTEVKFVGNVKLTRETACGALEIFNGVPTISIEDGASVVLDNRINTSGSGYVFDSVDNLTIGVGAAFDCYSSLGFCQNPLTNVTIGKKANVRFIKTGGKSSTYILYGKDTSTFNAEPGSKFFLYDNYSSSAWGAFWFATINLNNVESFVVLNASGRAIGNRAIATSLTVNGTSSIRYYKSDQISNLFNTSTYDYTPTRSPHRWWANTVPFGVTAAGWTNSSNPALTDNTYSNANVPSSSITLQTTLDSSNFGLSKIKDTDVYGIEIYGSLGTITYNGNGATSGTVPEGDAGVPNELITIKDNTGSLARYGYTFGGWNTEANGSGTVYKPGDTFSFTNKATLYAQWVPDKYTVSGTISGIATVSGLLVNYTIDGGETHSVTTDSNGNYTITALHGSDVVITPSAQTGYHVTPESITITDISANSAENNFVYTPYYTVTEKYLDELTGSGFGRNDTFVEYPTSPYNYKYNGSLEDIIEGNYTYMYMGYKIGNYNPGDLLDGNGIPEASNLTSDETVYLIYHQITNTIDVTFPTGSNWDFYVNQDTYPYVKTGLMGSSNENYEIRNNSDKPVHVDLSDVEVTEPGGLKLVKDASLSPPGSNEYSLNLTLEYPSVLLSGVTNSFATNTITGITEGSFVAGTKRLAALDGHYVKQPTPTATNGYITIGGYYAGNLYLTPKNPLLKFAFTFSIIE